MCISSELQQIGALDVLKMNPTAVVLMFSY
jgi:hypothetical protein